MRYELTILRKRQGETAQYTQRFFYEPQDEAETVATMLDRLNGSPALTDAAGDPADPILWECSCLQRKCGACAMVINGTPGLACDARLADYRKGKISLEPLRKFPVIADLKVDRSVMLENLKSIHLWLENEANVHERQAELAFEASRCLQCGCCLEVCPNFMAGGTFAGMSAAVPATRLLAELSGDEIGELSAHYRRQVYEGCGKSLACRNVCPAHIDIEEMLVNSNAAAVWKRLLR